MTRTIVAVVAGMLLAGASTVKATPVLTVITDDCRAMGNQGSIYRASQAWYLSGGDPNANAQVAWIPGGSTGQISLNAYTVGLVAIASVDWKVAVGSEPFVLDASVGGPDSSSVIITDGNYQPIVGFEPCYSGDTEKQWTLDPNQTYRLIANVTPHGGPGMSAGGSASITFNGTVIPEPASLSLLALGGLAVLRRKRK
ncbi:MAG: PEP-CTERM sorting domain-containing protein [Planctomycetota bacterium]